jgi:hypothetical protein
MGDLQLKLPSFPATQLRQELMCEAQVMAKIRHAPSTWSSGELFNAKLQHALHREITSSSRNLMSNLQRKLSPLPPPQLLQQEADQKIIKTASDDQAAGTNSSDGRSELSATSQRRGQQVPVAGVDAAANSARRGSSSSSSSNSSRSGRSGELRMHGMGFLERRAKFNLKDDTSR